MLAAQSSSNADLLMSEALKGSVPSGTEAVNLEGFDAGWAHFEKEYGSGKAEPEEAAAVVAGGRSVEEV